MNVVNPGFATKLAIRENLLGDTKTAEGPLPKLLEGEF
jgi:hypothetical protein